VGVVQVVAIRSDSLRIPLLQRQSDDLADTRTSGMIRRMPTTAMRMPMVRKIFCQNSDIFSSTRAFTTALSNDREISISPRITQRATAAQPP
jgi:hypothetical protein